MEMLVGKTLSNSLEDELTLALGQDPQVAKEFLRRKRLELILGSEQLDSLEISGGIETLHSLGYGAKIRLLRLYRRAARAIDLLVNVQGFQIFHSGIFNGDPHNGNILVLDDGSLGLIDFGQVKRISDRERLGVARIVQALNSGSQAEIAESMRSLGFRVAEKR